MEKLYLKIIEKLENSVQIFTDKELPPVKYIDLYRGQPINPTRFEFYDLPAIFIQYTANKNRIDLSVHVMTDPNHDTNSLSPNKLNGLNIIRYYETIKDILTDLESANTSKLHWVSDEPIDADVVNYHVITFACYYETIIYDKYPNSSTPEETELNIIEGTIKNKYIID